MSRWVCPQCGREFGIVHQAHTCRPGCSLEVVLPQPIEDRRVARHVRLSESRTVHMIKLDRVEEVDDQVCGWLTEAYLFATR